MTDPSNRFPRRDRLILGVLLAMLACRLVFAVVWVPPWQHPDEPQHVEYILTLVKQAEFRALQEINPGISQAVVQSMAAHHWWEFSNLPRPEPLPTSVRDVTASDTLLHPRAFYVLTAALLRVVRLDDVERSYWVLRVLSSLFGLVTALMVWLGARKAFGTSVAHGTLALLTWHPQFLLVSTAVNPDVLVNLCGAIVWWQSIEALAAPDRVWHPAVAIAAGALATLSKRGGIPLLALACSVGALTLLYALVSTRARGRLLSLTGGIAVAALLGGVVLAPELMRVYRYGADLYYTMPTLELATRDPHFLRDFSRNLFQSGWLNAGWLTIPAPWSWYLYALVLTAFVPVSALRLVLPGIAGRERLMMLLCWFFVLFQVAAIYATYYRAGYPAQGRYLFPVIGPFFALLWLGAVGWAPRRWQWAPAAALLVVVWWLDFTAWSDVVIPGFAR